MSLDLLEDAHVLLGNANFRLNAWGQKRFSEFLTEVGKRTLCEGIRADKHLFPDKFHAKSEHDHSSTCKSVSSNNPIIRISPFVPITVPMTTAELEENESGDLAQNLTTNLPNVVTQKNLPPSLLVAGPVQVDYPLPVLETLKPPTDKSASRLQFFCSKLEENNAGFMDITNNSGVQDPLLPPPQAASCEDYPYQ